MKIALLGPVEAFTGPSYHPVEAFTGPSYHPVAIVGTRQLALLALDAGRIVAPPRLIDGIWGDTPPARAGNALQALVSRLRRVLPEGVIESHPAGYRLAVDAEAVDAHRFERLVAEGRALLADEPARASARLREALGLWRGEALADLVDATFARAAAARLVQLRRPPRHRR